METNKGELQTRLIERLVVERDLQDSRVLSVELADGTQLTFHVHTISLDEKNALRRQFNMRFPAPPVLMVESPGGKIAQFDLENPDYRKKIVSWQEALSKAVLATSLGLSEEDVEELEQVLTKEQFTEVHTTVELLNGVHSAPMADLLRDAMWSPEVATWIETYKGDPDGVKITDTVLYHEMECMIGCGLTLRDWEDLSPRERMTYMEWFNYKNAREGYINWWTYSRQKDKPQKPW